MDGLALLGILLLLYAGMVFFITFKKPEKIWNISKIKAFKRDRNIFLCFWTSSSRSWSMAY